MSLVKRSSFISSGKSKGRLPNSSIFEQNGKPEKKVTASLEKIPLALDDECFPPWSFKVVLQKTVKRTICKQYKKLIFLTPTQLQGPKIVSTLSYQNIVQDVALMKHFTGHKPSQFEVLHDFLDDVCPLETINYWKSKDCPATENARTGPKADFSQEKNFSFAF